jgi:outer membrane protein assembly factor BamB
VIPFTILSIVALVTSSLAFQGTDPKTDAADRIVALDPRWSVSFETAPAAAAGYDQEHAYVPLKGGELMAINLNHGEVTWKAELATSFTPATGDGLVFTVSDRLIAALDQRSGRTVWRTPLSGAVLAPLYWDTGWLIASIEGGELVAMRAEDGQILWQQSLGSPLAAAPSPAGDRLYIALKDGRLAALQLDTGTLAWTHALNEEVTGILALDDQLVVGTRSNKLHSLSLTRGRVRWSQRAGADIAGAPAADDELIYFAALDNVLRALDRDNGNLKWTRRLSARPGGGPLRAGDVVLLPFVSADIAAFSAASGAEAFVIRAIGELGGAPFLRERARHTAPLLIAMSREGALQGFAPRIEPALTPLAELPGIKVGG